MNRKPNNRQFPHGGAPKKQWVRKQPAAPRSAPRSPPSRGEGQVRAQRLGSRVAEGIADMAAQAAGNIDAAVEIAAQRLEAAMPAAVPVGSSANAAPPMPPHPEEKKEAPPAQNQETPPDQRHSDVVQMWQPVLVPGGKGSLFGFKRGLLCAAAAGAVTLLSRGNRLWRAFNGACAGVVAAAGVLAAPYLLEEFRRTLNPYTQADPRLTNVVSANAAAMLINREPTAHTRGDLKERLVKETDRLIQKLSLKTGLIDAVEAGRVLKVASFAVDPPTEDLRPANVRANKRVPDRVALEYGLLQSRCGGTDIPLLYAPEVTTVVRASVPTVSVKDRQLQCQELATRVTNLNIPAPIWNVAHSGSATVAQILCANADVHRERYAELMGSNWVGVAAVPMLMAIASATVSPLLIAWIMEPTLSCTIRSLCASPGALCRYVLGHGSVT